MNIDVCIFGSGLSGLFTARALEARGFNVQVVETEERFGGQLRSTTSTHGFLGRDFGYWPASASTTAISEELSALLGQDLKTTEASLPPLTVNKGALCEFVGFGENAPPYVEHLQPFLGDRRTLWSMTWSEACQIFASSLKLPILFTKRVQQFEFQGGHIQTARFEDGISIEAKAFVFCGDTRRLFEVLPTDSYSHREIQKLLKSAVWSSVSLDLLHGQPITESLAVHLLSGTTKESHPCCGGFEPARTLGDQIVQASHWFTLVPADLEDEEIAANALREMKRQIKRAYGTALDNVLFEKISFDNESHLGLPIKIDAQSRWQGLDNFWVNRGYLNQKTGVEGALLQALLVIASVETHLSESTHKFVPSEARV